MSDDIQVFISYSRKDNLPWHTPADARGFVSYFHDALHYDLTDKGAASVRLWRDVKRVSDADQFEPVIEQEIRSSAVLLVILSPNWMESQYCRRELDDFGKRWEQDGSEAVKARIIVVNKHKVAPDRRPSLLMGQVGFSFYSELDPDSIQEPHEFFVRGEVRDPSFYDKISQVRAHLVRRAKRSDAGVTAPSPGGSPREPRPGGRTIFVAQPANDMIAHYDSVVRELQGLGHVVVPETQIPSDSKAAAFIDANLAKADLAIHLLGEKPGHTPEDAKPIVELQLERSALRTASGKPEAGSEVALKPLRRILWAPRALLDEGAAAGGAVDRDPMAVLRKFGGELLSGDKVDGQGRSRFIDFLKQEVELSAPSRPQALAIPGGKARIYLDHHSDDEEFGFKLAGALKGPNVSTILPVLDGDQRDRAAARRKRLSECDAVVLCWGAAREAWVRAEWDDLRDWRKFKRKDRFLFREVVAGPPPGSRKKYGRMLLDIAESPSDEEISDVTEDEGKLAAVAQALLRRLGQPAP